MDEHDGITTQAVSRRGFMSSAAASIAASEAAAAEPRTAPLPAAPEVDRAFVRIREGLVHYRSVGKVGGRTKAPRLPLYMAHAGPGSSASSVPLLRHFGRRRVVIAPDTLGAGDSAAPDMAQPDVAYYADSVVRILDALGIETVDFFGAHTGAHIGTELALRAPSRVRRLVLNGVALFPEEMKAQLLQNYAPPMQPDEYGRQLAFAWQFIRDMSLFFPHYARDPQHRLANPVNTPEGLNAGVVEVLKVLKTYHLGYHAVFRHDIASRLPLLKVPVLCMASDSDPLSQYLDAAAALVPGAKKALIPRGAGREEVAAVAEAFLEA